MSHPPEKGESREHGAHDPLPYCVHMSLHMSDVSRVCRVSYTPVRFTRGYNSTVYRVTESKIRWWGLCVNPE